MFNLSNSIKKTISIADGYKLGRLIFQGEKPYIELENGKEIEVAGLIVEVLNDDEWYQLEEEDYKRTTAEGWPLFGGFDCRYMVQEEIEEPRMTGDIYDYDSLRAYIMSGEKRIIISFIGDEEYQDALRKGMRIGAAVVFNPETKKIIKFF